MKLAAALVDCLTAIARDRGRVLVLTGAGISAESGIPTFRGKEGYWTVGSENYHPTQMATREAFAAMPHEVWRWYLYRRSVCHAAAPNEGHHALVRLEGVLQERFTLVTQNVDGLHLRAGQDPRRTFEIHGNTDFMRCPGVDGRDVRPIPLEIGEFAKGDPLTERQLQLLTRSGDETMGRPHVLWFDEYYDQELFSADSAMRAATTADLLVVVGTTGQTTLPAMIGQRAARRGIPIVDINIEDNVFGDLASHTGGHIVRGSAALALPAIVDVLAEATAHPSVG